VTAEGLLVLAIMGVAFTMFVKETLPPEVTALCVIAALALTGALDTGEALAGFGNDALVTVACMLVLSAGLVRTGALDTVTALLARLGGGRRQVLVVFAAVPLLSAFMNNTPVALMFMPVVIGLAQRQGIAPSRLLIPLSFATILGGMCTLIGTSTNILVAKSASAAGVELHLFDVSVPGAIYAGTGLAFLLLFGRMLLPQRAAVTPLRHADAAASEFVTEITVPDGSPMIGRTWDAWLAAAPAMTPLMLVRGGRARPVRSGPVERSRAAEEVRRAARALGAGRALDLLDDRSGTHVPAQAGDRLLLRSTPGTIDALIARGDVSLAPEFGTGPADGGRTRTATLVELVVTPNSALVGRTLQGADFLRDHPRLSVVAVLRGAGHLSRSVMEVPLSLGDRLLALVDESALDSLAESDDFLMVEGIERRVRRRDKTLPAALIMAAVVGVAAAGWADIALTSLAGALAMVLTGCLPLRRAWDAINLPMLVVIAGMVALAAACEKTGLVSLLSGQVVEWAQPHGPRALLAGLFLLSAVATAFVSNSAVALLVTPVAVQVARQLGFDPLPFVVSVMFGASCDFSTPFGYQTNLLVYGPGGYRFMDYPRIGVPLTAVLFAVSMVIIPWWFPFARLAP
jgi:di/tricarboxylate transporter